MSLDELRLRRLRQEDIPAAARIAAAAFQEEGVGVLVERMLDIHWATAGDTPIARFTTRHFYSGSLSGNVNRVQRGIPSFKQNSTHASPMRNRLQSQRSARWIKGKYPVCTTHCPRQTIHRYARQVAINNRSRCLVLLIWLCPR